MMILCSSVSVLIIQASHTTLYHSIVQHHNQSLPRNKGFHCCQSRHAERYMFTMIHHSHRRPRLSGPLLGM